MKLEEPLGWGVAISRAALAVVVHRSDSIPWQLKSGHYRGQIDCHPNSAASLITAARQKADLLH